MTSYELYTRTPPLKLYFLVAVPGAVSMIASSLWGVFDGIFVGQLLGPTAFAALNLAFPFVLINFSLADLIGVGSAVPISIALGRRDEKTANNVFTCACILIFLTGVLMGAAMYALAPATMGLMGAQGELREMAVRYIRVYALWSPVTTVMFAVDNYLRICGRIRGSMLLNIFMSALILALEYLCLGVLGMGIGGSALAVSLGMFLCAVVALTPFFRGRMTLRFCRPVFSGVLVRQIVRNGSPVFLSSVAARLTGILMNMVLLELGGSDAVSVYGILMYAGDTLMQLLYGACDSLQPALGYNYGAGSRRRVRAIAGLCLAAGAVICFSGAAVMFCFPEAIASLFLGAGEAELLSMVGPALRLYSLAYLTRWFGFAVQSFLIAVEKPRPATVLSVANAFFFPVALLVLLRPLGLAGVWLNTPVTALLVSVLAVLLIRREKKRGNS